MKRIFTEEQKVKRKLYNDLYKALNKEKEKERLKIYNSRPDIKKRNREKNKRWIADNPEREKARRNTSEYKDKAKALSAKYRVENAEKLRLNRIEYNDKPENIARKAAAKHNGNLVIEPPTRPRPLTCDICNGGNEHNARMHFDHCHTTGKFRGWLCSKCNMALGLLNDDKERLAKLIEYLK